ncbi:hypothetical protein CO251_11330 [Sulfobacillus sp. hq2]|nr:hypothetical protein CO251_11330 [Sulfobacillus sp. hq2]
MGCNGAEFLRGREFMGDAPDVLIVGGGVIGCALAYDLAASGLDVTVLEQERVGAGVSYGAGGMLAPQIEFAQGGPGLEWGMRSLTLYQEWDEAIRQRIGFGLDLDLSGIVRVTNTPNAWGPSDPFIRRHTQMGYVVKRLDASTIREWAPQIHPAITSGIWVVGGQVDAYRATRMMAQAAVSHNALIRSGVMVTGIEDGCVMTTAGRLCAQMVIVATGAWLPHLVDVPLKPVKGQRLLVALPQLLARVPIFGDNIYVVPKASGQYFLGATTEPEAGYDQNPTLEALMDLGTAAVGLFPELRHASVIEPWAGLRPVLPGELPLIARVPRYERVLAVGGHYRHGFLLAPITARIVRDWMVSNAPLPPDFSYQRFETA